MCDLPGHASETGCVSISGTIGTVGGDIVGRDKITIASTILGQDPAVLVEMAKIFAERESATTEARVQAEAQAAELAAKLSCTTSDIATFFKIIGVNHVLEENIQERLIEIATRFARMRKAVALLGLTAAALAVDNRHVAKLARRAKNALEKGHFTDAEMLLDEAKDAARVALRQSRANDYSTAVRTDLIWSGCTCAAITIWDEIWHTPITNTYFCLPHPISSRRAANSILNQAGLGSRY
jgi:hypothetical protein